MIPQPETHESKEPPAAMPNELPQKRYEYVDHWVIDSRRWSSYNHRPGDIVISTSYKAGTTWMQTIVANLLFQDGQFPAPVGTMSPWIDCAAVPVPLEQVIAGLDAQTHRRFIKTHLPLDALPYFETIRYIVVGRDGRDVLLSLWNHHMGYSDMVRGLIAEFNKTSIQECPVTYPDIHHLCRDWIDRSWYSWEQSGFPYWSHFRHMQSWWDYRHLENIQFVHFADLLSDPEKEVRRVAAHIGVTVNEDLLPGILERIAFQKMKESFDTQIMPDAMNMFQGGGQTFMNKGTNGRWRNVLTEAELAGYQAAVEKEMTPDCAHWLENGGAIAKAQGA